MVLALVRLALLVVTVTLVLATGEHHQVTSLDDAGLGAGGPKPGLGLAKGESIVKGRRISQQVLTTQGIFLFGSSAPSSGKQQCAHHIYTG